MPRIASIVEGHGEVQAVPILIRRIAEILVPEQLVDALRPIRVPRSRLLRPGEIERAVELAARRTGPQDGILVLIDAERDPPCKLGPDLFDRASRCRPDRAIRVVLAKCEYEGWFLAAAESLRGARGLSETLQAPPLPEEVRDAKGWLTRHLAGDRAYRETLDQPALTGRFDLERARSAQSFDKLWRDLASLLVSQ